MTVTIEAVQKTDAPELFAIYEKVEAASEYPIGPHWSPEQFAEECAELGSVLRANLTGVSGQIAAFVLYRDVYDAYEITLLATSLEALRRGFMAQLLQAWLKAPERAKPVWLEVHESNQPARNLYEKLGFLEVGKRPRYYPDGGAAVLYNYG